MYWCTTKQIQFEKNAHIKASDKASTTAHVDQLNKWTHFAYANKQKVLHTPLCVASRRQGRRDLRVLGVRVKVRVKIYSRYNMRKSRVKPTWCFVCIFRGFTQYFELLKPENNNNSKS